MITAEWARAEDRQEIVDFIDYVFSVSHNPHDFASLFPALYGEGGDGAPHHFVLREDGRIAATLLAWPGEIRTAGEALPYLGVGSVSVHPRMRGRGYMKRLMDAVDARANETGACFSVLGGKRQRYGYYGYRSAGVRMTALLTLDNARRALPDAGGLRLAPMTEAHVPAAMALHAAQPCFCAREASRFLGTMRAWRCDALALLGDGGELVGFASARRERDGADVQELLLADEAALPRALALLFGELGELTLSCMPWQTRRAKFLASVCERFELRPDGMYKFYDEARVARVFGALADSLGWAGRALSFDGFLQPLPLCVPHVDQV